MPVIARVEPNLAANGEALCQQHTAQRVHPIWDDGGHALGLHFS